MGEVHGQLEFVSQFTLLGWLLTPGHQVFIYTAGWTETGNVSKALAQGNSYT